MIQAFTTIFHVSVVIVAVSVAVWAAVIIRHFWRRT